VTLSVVRSGHGLRGGAATVELRVESGPVRLGRDGIARPLEAFRVVDARFSTSLACDAFVVGTTEHFFAALAGLGVRGGLRADITGDELPLLDGGALELARAVGELGIAPRAPALRVVRDGAVTVDGATYDFSTSDGVRVEVDVELPRGCATSARWDGDASSFLARVAPARTFVLERDASEIARLGLGRNVAPSSVLIVAEGGVFGTGDPAPDEPARHKLLDLIGDAYLHGGPPRGTLRASRPGHARTHRAFARALDLGILEKDAS